MSNNSGNVLFLILIAVALFAALSYAVTSSNRVWGSNEAVSQGKMETAFGEIKNVVVAHRQAVQRMIMAGVPPENISAFKAGGVGPHAYHFDNSNCSSASTNHKCKLYHPQGGGLSYYDFTKRHPSLAVLPYNIYSNFVSYGSWGDSINAYQSGGTAARDFLYSIRISKEFCDFINEKIKVDYTGVTSGWTTQSALGFLYQLSGSPGADTTGIGGQHHARHLFGKDMGCWWTNRDGGSYYFTALIYLR